MSEPAPEEFTTARYLMILAVCVLPTLLGMALYWLIGRRESLSPSAFTKLIAWVVAVVHLLMLVVVASLCIWGILSGTSAVMLYALTTLIVAALQGTAALFMMLRSRPRLLLGWSLGGLVGMAVALVIVGFGVYATFSVHAGALVLLLSALLLPVVFSLGPLLMAPFVWLWVRQVHKRQAQAAGSM